MSSQTKINISASPRMITDDKGNGMRDGESFTLFVILGGKTFQTMRFYGDKKEQESARAKAQADVKQKVQIHGQS